MRSVAAARWLKGHLLLGRDLQSVSAGWSSRVVLAALPMIVLAKERTRWRATAVPVRIRFLGRTFTVRLADRTDLHVLHEIGVGNEYGLPDDLRPDVIVDLGAHIGLATLYFLAARPTARVIAVEADPVLVGRLRHHVAGLPVTVIHAAVAAERGEMTFYRGRTSWENSLTPMESDQVGVAVRALTFADVLDQAGVEHVGLLKIDVEGAEWDVLRDGPPPVVDAIVGEIHPVAGHRAAELLARIAVTMEVTVTREIAELVVFSARRPRTAR